MRKLYFSVSWGPSLSFATLMLIADDTSKMFNLFFKKKMKFQIFIALYLNSVCEKCIKMSTNKPSVESVVLEIAL